MVFFFSSRRRHTRFSRDWSSDVCSSDLLNQGITDMNFQPRGLNDQALQGPASYQAEVEAARALLETHPTWNGVTAEAVARMRSEERRVGKGSRGRRRAHRASTQQVSWQ